MSDLLPDFIEAFRLNLMDLYDALGKYVLEEDLDATRAAALVVALSRFKDDIDIVYRDAVTVAIEKMDDETIHLDDGSAVEKKWERPRKAWRHEDLSAEVIQRLIHKSIDPETGEFTLSMAELAKETLNYAGISYWKVTMLKRLDIDPGDYCEQGDFEPKLMIKKG